MKNTEQWVPDEGTMNVNIAPGKLGLTKMIHCMK